MEIKSGIYCIENLINGKKYVGKGSNVIKRMNDSHYNSTYLNRAIKKYGTNSFIRYIIECCEIDELNKKEQYYIKELKTKVPNGYNLTDGGEGSTGWVPSLETREKQSISKKGKNRSPESIKKQSNSLKGHYVSPETKKKQSNSQKGRMVTQKMRNAVSKAHKGKHPSLQTREKMSKSQTGRITSPETKEKISIANTNPSLETIEKKRNAALKRKSVKASSSFYGVCLRKDGWWVARVSSNGIRNYIGCYKTELEAAIACDKYIIKWNLLNPLNFPENYSNQ